MKFKSFGIVFVGTVLLLVGGLTAYDHLSVGANSIPVAESQALVTLPMQVESFHSQAMGRDRQYGIILPPGYAEHPDQRYPVIFLLHQTLVAKGVANTLHIFPGGHGMSGPDVG